MARMIAPNRAGAVGWGRLLKIHEITTASGALSAVSLRLSRGALLLVEPEGELPLPSGALAAVMERFGAPFDADATIRDVDALDLGAGGALRHVRHRAGYDVIARDYLVYERAGREPLCALATTVA